EKLDSVNEHRRDLIQDKEILESKVERLEVENSSLEDKLTVANSKLLEKEYDLSKMPEIEFKGRLVIDRLEKGYEPKNKKDRKSTRLNSSHVSISYAVFCLKKKKIRRKR